MWIQIKKFEFFLVILLSNCSLYDRMPWRIGNTIPLLAMEIDDPMLARARRADTTTPQALKKSMGEPDEVYTKKMTLWVEYGKGWETHNVTTYRYINKKPPNQGKTYEFYYDGNKYLSSGF